MNSTHPLSRAHAPALPRRARGITMVEALVALVVLSVGMLGIASLYVASLQAGRTALLRTQAITLVNDMADRIRANGLARDAYDTAKGVGGAPADNDCVASEDDNNCSFTELAKDDLARWLDVIPDTLPGGAGAVTVDRSAVITKPDTYVVRVEWQEPGDTEKLSYQMNLSIIALVVP
jgi:type IV pilus assembly protein PilV